MAGIGLRLPDTPWLNVNIEDTLLFASLDALELDEPEVLDMLATWFHTHHARIIAERFIHLVHAAANADLVPMWRAIATLRPMRHETRFDRLRRPVERPLAKLPSLQSNAVLSPPELAAHHRGYILRTLFGPTARADVWAFLELDPHERVGDLARIAHCSFATAWRTKRDFMLAAEGSRLKQARSCQEEEADPAT